jgi:hypothetical protein
MGITSMKYGNSTIQYDMDQVSKVMKLLRACEENRIDSIRAVGAWEQIIYETTPESLCFALAFGLGGHKPDFSRCAR